MGDGHSLSERLRRHLHHAALVVRQQDVILAVLLVDDHVDWAVAVSELGDCRPLYLVARFQRRDRELDERRAQVAGDDRRFAVDLIRHECEHGRERLHLPVGAVVDLDARALVHRPERIRDHPHLGRELFVRQARDIQVAADEGHVRNGLHAHQPRGVYQVGVVVHRDGSAVREHQRRRGRRRIGHPDLRIADAVERNDVDLARPVHTDEDRHRASAHPAHRGNVGVARLRIDHHVGDHQVAGVNAEQPGDLLVDSGHILRSGRAPGHLLGQLQGGDGHVLAVGREDHARGSERQFSDVLELGCDTGHCRGLGCCRGPGDYQGEYGDEQQGDA